MRDVVRSCAAATSMRTPPNRVEGVPPEYCYNLSGQLDKMLVKG